MAEGSSGKGGLRLRALRAGGPEPPEAVDAAARGEWRTGAAGDLGKTAGFHLSSLYSPVGWFSWGDAAKYFEQAQKNSSLLQVFVNTVQGETWTLLGEAPDWQKLYDRREDYQIGVVPREGLFLTAGVDVQKDRIEVEIAAWGRGKESWSVDYRVFEGDTSRAGCVGESSPAVLNRNLPTTASCGVGVAHPAARHRLRIRHHRGLPVGAATVRRLAGGRDQGRLTHGGSCSVRPRPSMWVRWAPGSNAGFAYGQ